MRSLAVLVSIGVLGIVGPQSAAPAASAGSGTAVFSAAVAAPDVRQLTTSPGSDARPAPSPDGSLIAFVRDLNGSDSLYVMRSEGDGLAQLWSPTLSSDVPSETLGTPVWSPDGKTLLVTECVCVDSRYPSVSLNLVPLDGSAPHTIRPWGAPATGTFSGDGRYVAYQAYRTWDSHEQVGVIGPDGTLRSFGRGTLATWSPTRDRLAYIASASGFLTIVDPDGRHRWTLRTQVSGAFAWSPGGRRIAFLRNQAGSPTLLLARPGSPRVSRVITLPAAGLDKSSYALSWSRDGRWLAATTDTLSLLVRTDGADFQAILGGGSAVWAPTGHTLAFVAPNGFATSLQTWPTPALIDQAPVGSYYEGLAWSPDGTRLIFARGGSTQ